MSRGLLASALILQAMQVNADDAPRDSMFLEDTYTLWLGGFFPSLDSQVRLDPVAGTPGDGIDFEDVLGLADGKSVLFGGFKWRPSLRHMIEFEFIQLNRSGQVAGISESLEIGDYVIEVGGDVQTVFDVAIGRFTYGYDLVSNGEIALNLKAGLHIASFDTVLQLSGAVFRDGVPIGDPTTVIEQKGSITAPLPHFGLSYGQAISETVAVRAQALVFAIKYDGYKGMLLDFGVDVQYRPWETFGLGAGIRYFRTTVEDDSDDGLRGKFSYEYVGPVIYGTWSF
jgi:hypothetical protein